MSNRLESSTAASSNNYPGEREQHTLRVQRRAQWARRWGPVIDLSWQNVRMVSGCCLNEHGSQAGGMMVAQRAAYGVGGVLILASRIQLFASCALIVTLLALIFFWVCFWLPK